MPELERKIIVIAEVSDLRSQDFINNIRIKGDSLVLKSVQFPSLDPAPGNVVTKVNAMQTLENQREAIMVQYKEKTQEIKAARKDITEIVVDKYPGQIQTDAAGDIALIKSVNYGVKYEDESEPEVSIGNSKPVVTDTNINRHLEHTFTVINSKSEKKALPEDALRCDYYEYIGDNPPADYKQWTYKGSTSRGKVTNHFTEDQVGKFCHYALIYVPKASATGTPELSGKLKLQIT